MELTSKTVDYKLHPFPFFLFLIISTVESKIGGRHVIGGRIQVRSMTIIINDNVRKCDDGFN